MKIQISDVIASAALIISIFSICYQNRGIHKQLLVANISEYTRRYQKIFEKFPKVIAEENFQLNKLSDDEQDYILRYMWLYFDLCYEEYTLRHTLKIVDYRLWELWKNAMISSFSRPAFYQCWQIIIKHSFYPNSFYQFVDRQMKEKHVLRRKV
jgi:hypothetical protein